MKMFWDKIVLPLIKKENARYIVEIGSENGGNTQNILKYCQEYNAKMVAIDPSPKFDVDDLKNKYGNKFKFYKGLSLSILPLLKDYDVILIDGDHNWYTVYNELKLIEKAFKGKKFPLIFLHDVGWPYGRRDLYYNPETIPEAYRQPYKKKGMYPGKSDLKENGGFNLSLFNAINENTPKNGVLTAVEDFIVESDLNFHFEKIDVFNGLGILFVKNDKLENIVKKVINEANFLNKLEKQRLFMIINYSDLRNQNKMLVNDLNQNKTKLEKVGKELNLTKIELNEKGDELLHVYQQLDGERAVVKEMEVKLDELGSELGDVYQQLDGERAVVKGMEVKLGKVDSELGEVYQQLKEKQENLQRAENQFEELSIQINNLSARFYEMEYSNNKNRPLIQRVYSKFPSLYILFNRKNTNIKNALINIKGYKAIKNNNLLDVGYYLKNNGDVRVLGMDPILHYVYHGFKEKRRPNPKFDGDYYLKKYSDVRNSNLNPLVHYSLYGLKEGRKTHDIPSQSPELKLIPGKEISGNDSKIIPKEINADNQKFIANLESKFKVSIVMPTYNREYIIKRAINSVLNQTFSNYELIICDDGSTDETEELLKKDYAPYFKSGKFIYIRKEHVGVSRARNNCLKRSKGDLIAYLDTDNYWESTFLEKMVSLFYKNPEFDSAYCALHHHNLDRGTDSVLNKQYDREKILRRNHIDLNTFMHRRTLYESLKGFNESLTRLVDWDIILRYTKNNPPLFLDEILVQYYISGNFNNITLHGSYIDHRNKIYSLYSNEIISRALSENNFVEDPLVTSLYLESEKPIYYSNYLKIGVLMDTDLKSLNDSHDTRLYSPLKQLSLKERFKIFFYGKDDFSKVNIDKTFKCKLFDVLIIQNDAIDFETSKIILKKCYDHEIKIIFDLDDNETFKDNDESVEGSKNKSNFLDYLIKNSDLVTVSNLELSKRISVINKTFMVSNSPVKELIINNGIKTENNLNSTNSEVLNDNSSYLVEQNAKKWQSIFLDVVQKRKSKDYKISIILPIYNMEKYLKETLESIEKQTIGLENLEVLMINEASSDGSKLIIDEYAGKYENFIALHLTESSGTPGKPRNIGIEMATGDYIMFIDHDDFYTADACEILYNKITSEDADIVSGIYNFVRGNDIKKLNDKTNILLKLFKDNKEIKVKSIEENEELLSSPPVVWSKIFRRDFLIDTSLRFPVGTLAEDLIFLSTALLKAHGIIFLDHIVYNYRILNKGEEASISHKSDKNWFKGVIDARKIIYDTYRNEGKEKYFKQICQYSLNYLLDVFSRSDMKFDDKIEILEYMHWLIEKSNEYGVSPPEEYLNLFNLIINKDYVEAVKISKNIS